MSALWLHRSFGIEVLESDDDHSVLFFNCYLSLASHLLARGFNFLVYKMGEKVIPSEVVMKIK